MMSMVLTLWPCILQNQPAIQDVYTGAKQIPLFMDMNKLSWMDFKTEPQRAVHAMETQQQNMAWELKIVGKNLSMFW